MLTPNGNITIGDYLIPFLPQLEIDSSILALNDSAKITLNVNVSVSGRKFTDLIKKGDRVVINLGYEPYLFEAFTGYISRINGNGRTVVIICEDESYFLKRTLVKNKVELGANTTLSQLMTAIAPEIKTNILKDIKIGKWVIQQNVSVSKVLDRVKRLFSVYFYYRDGILIMLAGLKNDNLTQPQIDLSFQKNVPIGESDLELESEQTDNMIVHGKSSTKDGKTTNVYAYYNNDGVIQTQEETIPDGVVVGKINLGENDVIDTATLRESCVRKLESISYEGLGGSVVTYGYPQLKHGYELNIADLNNPDVDGVYKCVRNVTTFSHSGGLRQRAYLGIKIK